jgi:AcrR family transcriptional regulator
MPRINTEYREDAKKKIIAAALEIVAERGWDAATLDAISQKVGVTKGALYAYFENSEALQREMILVVFGRVRAGLEAALEKDEEVPATIRNLAGLIFDQMKPYAAVFCQMPVRIPTDSRYREEFTRIFDGNILLFRDFLARGMADRKIPRQADPAAAASAIIALTLGLRISSLFLGKDDTETKKIWIDTVEQILGLGPAGNGKQ